MAQFILPADAPLRLRDSQEKIEQLYTSIVTNSLLEGVLESYPGLVTVLNRHRQIVLPIRRLSRFFRNGEPATPFR